MDLQWTFGFDHVENEVDWGIYFVLNQDKIDKIIEE